MPFPLSSKDPFGEFQNPHECPAVLHELQQLPNDYSLSAAYIRANRPRSAGPALQFWLSPLSRAHFLNALLLRGTRSLVQAQRDLDVGAEKLYDYLPRWGIDFAMLRRDVQLEDASGQTYAAEVEGRDEATRTATVRVKSPARRVTATFVGYASGYDERDRPARVCVYRTRERVEVCLLPYPVLARLAGVSETGVRQLVKPTAGSGNVPLVELADFEAAVPRARWAVPLADALNATNRCGCVFWDHQRLACGLGQALPAAGAACEDHVPPSDAERA